jgi:integrase/recombinase XerD
MPKNNRNGQSAILTDSDYARIRKQFVSEKYKLLWDIAKYTGERWGAILQLKVSDVYQEGKSREEITFRASTRKATPDGRRETRQVPVHPTLGEILSAYNLPSGDYLFPGPLFDKPMSRQAADVVMRKAVERAGLSSKGISTHSTRRTFITRLNESGIDISTIQKITGHKDIKALNRYIEISPERIKGAIAVI